MSDTKQDIMQRVLAKNSLPSLSPVAVRLMSMAADDTSSVKDIASVIETDPGLAARLLRMVNSAAYRRDKSITSISRALTMIGLREVRIMALSISLRDTLPAQRESDFNYAQFWRGSLHRSLLARQTALRLGGQGAEEAFAAGLLLEIGLPILLRVLTPEEALGFPGFGAPLRQVLTWSQEHLGLDHRQVGIEVMTKWDLPEIFIVCEQIPPDPPPPNLPAMVKITDFARLVAELLFLPEIPFMEIHSLAQKRFGFDHEAINQIISSALAQAGETAEALEIEVNQESDMLAVMEKANEALSRLSSKLEPHVRQAVNLPRLETSTANSPNQVDAIIDTLEAVMHEIRNPLMSVGGFAKRLAQQAQSGQSVQQYAEVIMHEAKRLDEVLGEIKRILTPFTPKPVSMDLMALLEEIKNEMEENDKTQQEENPENMPSEIKWHLSVKTLPMVADQAALKSVIVHLINYGRYLLNQGNHSEGPLQIHVQIKDGEVFLRIFGSGSPPMSGRNYLASRSFGPELMLAEARRVVEGHAGELEAAPIAQNQGFMLTATLPLKPPAAN